MLLGFQLLVLSLSMVWLPSGAQQLPPPVSISSDGFWYGDDGTWSTVQIGVGSSPQYVNVYPNTVGQEIWVIGVEACGLSYTCDQNRGLVFYTNESTTWESSGTFELDADNSLGVAGFGYYGDDNIQVDDQITAPQQLLSVVNDTQEWIGNLGLGVYYTNYTNLEQLSLISTLVENLSVVPSHSYGYTAGAYYRLQGVPASLTLGGVDQNRFVPNNATFFLSPYEQPVVPLNTITVTAAPFSRLGLPAQLSSPSTLLTPGVENSFTIDSSTSYLWLPETACDAFSSALGLIYDENLQLYTYGNDTSIRQNLLNWNLSFTFNIADGGSNSVNITLPFQAFDHSLSLPFPGLKTTLKTTSNQTSIKYFPLRKAANNTQYTLGRVFLQEAYLTVDYERNNFSVSQAAFSMEGITNTNLIGISPPPNSNFTNPFVNTPHSSLSTADLAGIGVGSAIAGALVFMAVILLTWRWRRRASFDGFWGRIKYRKTSKPLTDVIWCRQRSAQAELQGTRQLDAEMANDPSTTKYELPADSPVELPGSEVADYRLPAYDDDSLHSGTSLWSGVQVVSSRASAMFEKGRSPVSPLNTEETGLSASTLTNTGLRSRTVNSLTRAPISEHREDGAEDMRENETRRDAARTESLNDITHIPTARRYSWES